MKKLILICFLAFGVAGCSQTLTDGIKSVAGYTVSQDTVDAARSSYNGLFLAPAAKYSELPTCKSGQSFVRNQCKEKTVLVSLQSADRTVEKAFNDLQRMIDTKNNSGAVAAYESLKIAINSATGLIVSFGIK